LADKEINIKITTETDTGPVDDLASSVEDLQSNADGASESFDGAAESADGLGASTESVTGGGIGDAASEADALGESASNADAEVQNLNVDLGMIEAGAMMGVADQLGQIGANAEGMAQEMNGAAISVGQLSTNVGMAEPQMVSLINHISNATFPQNEAMAYVGALNQMGVSADKLGDSATNMDRINDATGIGYTNVMQLTQGLQSVGVSADNLPSAFNAIAYAQANVNGGAGTLTQVLKRQASTINEYGLNTDQLVLIMQKLSQQGVQGMKMGSELSKVLKENNGDISAVEQSLGMQAGTLSNASQATGEYEGQLQQLADEEAEHKTITDQLNAVWEDVSLALSPILSPLGSFMGLIGQAGSYAVGINGLVTLAQSMNTLRNAEILSTIATKASAAAQWLLNIAMDANPIMLVVLAIIALVAILAYLYFNNEQVRNAINALGQTFVWIGQVIYTSIMSAVNTAISWFNTLRNYVVGFANNFINTLRNASANAVNGFVSYITQLPGRLKGELDNMLQMAQSFMMDIANMMTGGAAGMVVGWITGSGEHSPGYMYDAFQGELKEMENIAEDTSSNLPKTIRGIGSNIVDEFGEPTFNLGYEDTANAGISNISNNSNTQGMRDLIINIDSVDSRDRVQELVDEIIRQLRFDNKTAGRSV
jgi:hypothetical protein